MTNDRKHTKKKVPLGHKITNVDKILMQYDLQTVCQNARCPNLDECFNAGTATFLIMGNTCTRNCRFCAIASGKPVPLDSTEPIRLANAASQMNLRFVVITSVTRDDLPDGGVEHFAHTIHAVREKLPKAHIEVLVPDFQGNTDLLQTVINAKPDVFNHNIETVPELYSKVRPQADFERSLKVLKTVKLFDQKMITKSGMMLGVGETGVQLIRTFKRLSDVGIDILTIGQYFQADKTLLPVEKFWTDEEFIELEKLAQNNGIKYVVAGKYVRSSYKAQKAYDCISAR
ncbi:MAG: lipoyl synthase [Planctomycetes bacterium]|nr:lipoyl synthase [Planctomycetota bacterium]